MYPSQSNFPSQSDFPDPSDSPIRPTREALIAVRESLQARPNIYREVVKEHKLDLVRRMNNRLKKEQASHA